MSAFSRIRQPLFLRRFMLPIHIVFHVIYFSGLILLWAVTWPCLIGGLILYCLLAFLVPCLLYPCCLYCSAKTARGKVNIASVYKDKFLQPAFAVFGFWLEMSILRLSLPLLLVTFAFSLMRLVFRAFAPMDRQSELIDEMYIELWDHFSNRISRTSANLPYKFAATFAENAELFCRRTEVMFFLFCFAGWYPSKAQLSHLAENVTIFGFEGYVLAVALRHCDSHNLFHSPKIQVPLLKLSPLDSENEKLKDILDTFLKEKQNLDDVVAADWLALLEGSTLFTDSEVSEIMAHLVAANLLGDIDPDDAVIRCATGYWQQGPDALRDTGLRLFDLTDNQFMMLLRFIIDGFMPSDILEGLNLSFSRPAVLRMLDVDSFDSLIQKGVINSESLPELWKTLSLKELQAMSKCLGPEDMLAPPYLERGRMDCEKGEDIDYGESIQIFKYFFGEGVAPAPPSESYWREKTEFLLECFLAIKQAARGSQRIADTFESLMFGSGNREEILATWSPIMMAGPFCMEAMLALCPEMHDRLGHLRTFAEENHAELPECRGILERMQMEQAIPSDNFGMGEMREIHLGRASLQRISCFHTEGDALIVAATPINVSELQKGDLIVEVNAVSASSRDLWSDAGAAAGKKHRVCVKYWRQARQMFISQGNLCRYLDVTPSGDIKLTPPRGIQGYDTSHPAIFLSPVIEHVQVYITAYPKQTLRSSFVRRKLLNTLQTKDITVTSDVECTSSPASRVRAVMNSRTFVILMLDPELWFKDPICLLQITAAWKRKRLIHFIPVLESNRFELPYGREIVCTHDVVVNQAFLKPGQDWRYDEQRIQQREFVMYTRAFDTDISAMPSRDIDVLVLDERIPENIYYACRGPVVEYSQPEGVSRVPSLKSRQLLEPPEELPKNLGIVLRRISTLEVRDEVVIVKGSFKGARGVCMCAPDNDGCIIVKGSDLDRRRDNFSIRMLAINCRLLKRKGKVINDSDHDRDHDRDYYLSLTDEESLAQTYLVVPSERWSYISASTQWWNDQTNFEKIRASENVKVVLDGSDCDIFSKFGKIRRRIFSGYEGCPDAFAPLMVEKDSGLQKVAKIELEQIHRPIIAQNGVARICVNRLLNFQPPVTIPAGYNVQGLEMTTQEGNCFIVKLPETNFELSVSNEQMSRFSNAGSDISKKWLNRCPLPENLSKYVAEILNRFEDKAVIQALLTEFNIHFEEIVQALAYTWSDRFDGSYSTPWDPSFSVMPSQLEQQFGPAPIFEESQFVKHRMEALSEKLTSTKRLNHQVKKDKESEDPPPVEVKDTAPEDSGPVEESRTLEGRKTSRRGTISMGKGRKDAQDLEASRKARKAHTMPASDHTDQIQISLTRERVFKGVKKSNANNQYMIGDTVEFRDKDDPGWEKGVVTCLSPLKVRPLGWDDENSAQGFTWDEVRDVLGERVSR